MKKKWTWKLFVDHQKNLEDAKFEIGDGITLKRSDDPERLFYQMNVMSCSDDVFSFLLNDPFPVICMDPPWKTGIIRSDAYNTEDDQKMLDFFSNRVSKLFTPSEKEKEGFLFLWYLNNKRSFSLRCLYAAGYEIIADETWNKTTNDGNDRLMSLYRGTAEHFFVGRKKLNHHVNPNDWKKVVLNDDVNMYASHSFSGAPFSSMMHSSKPLEFYTDFVPTFLKIYASHLVYHESFKKCRKLDLFTREIQPGYLSAGLQFHGVRMRFQKACCEICHKRTSSDQWVGCQHCVRVWHVKCVRKETFSTEPNCHNCHVISQPKILVRLEKIDQQEKASKERESSRPLKKLKSKLKRVRVRGTGKKWWTGVALPTTMKVSQVLVQWDKPNKKGPFQEMVDINCIQWV